MLNDDGYGSIGFYSNAICYVGQFIGALCGSAIIEKLNDRKSMAIGSFFTLPMIVILIAPAYKSD